MLAGQIHLVQDVVRRPFLLENPSSYVGYLESTMTEPEFLTELVARTGCRLLCDVSNVHLSAHNMGFDAEAYLRALPWSAIAELHLGGFEMEADDATPGTTVIVDTHGAIVDAASWALYEHAVELFGPKPTVIERDSDIPGLNDLCEEALQARVHARTGVARMGLRGEMHVAV